ncbi:MAG: serine/threonine protein kinase, partial [Gemmataceae bacterium]
RGILLRDLKPSNVMLGRYGETLVVDWGLAKHLSSRDGEPEEEVMLPASEASMTETLPGAALGTPQYMSPEQAAGRLDELGTRSDIYGLGASLYHLLTGRAPFDGAELHVLLEQVRTGRFKRPRQVRRSLPRPLEEVCLKAMALRPEDRYASAQELAEDIERWLADEPVTAYEEPGWQQMRRWIRRHALQVGLGSIVAFAVLVSWFAYLAFESTVNSSREALIEGTQESNRFAAQFVASSISWQINQRFDMLEDVSRSNRMRLLVAAAAGQDRASPERQALQRQLERVRKEYDSVLGQGSEIWSIYDDRGFQVARSPLPTAAERDTIGENFAYRDYFHHRGRDLPRGSDLRDVQPYRSRLPYISSIHRETVSERWVVPFSIAIWDSDEPGAKVIGVLTMAVFLGGFGELRNYNGPQFATLVNLGPDEAGGRGLILQHPDLVASSAQYYIDPNSEQTLQHLATTMYRLQQEGRPASEALRAPTYLAWSAAYRDPVGHIIPLYAGEWMAEAWPVFINLPNHERINTGWVVIIQEPRDGALKPIRTLRQELIQLGLLALGLLLLLVAVIYAAVALFSRRRATPPKAIH